MLPGRKLLKKYGKRNENYFREKLLEHFMHFSSINVTTILFGGVSIRASSREF
jgi:hypothetical protein